MMNKNYEINNLIAFKARYLRDYNNLNKFSSCINSFIDSLDISYLINTKQIILNYKHENIELINETNNFFISLNDRDILNTYAFISDRNPINITEEKNNLYVGKCVESNDSIDITVVKNNTIEDYSNIAHEYGHAIQSVLFNTDLNKIVKYNLSEISSYYFEALMMHYLEDKSVFNLPENILLNNKYRYITNYIWDTKLAKYIYNLDEYNESKIKEYTSSIFNIDCTKDEIDSLTLPNLIEATNYISSFMIAIKLYEDTIKDQEEGLNEYKTLMTSPQINLDKLLDYNSLNFFKDNSSYEKQKELSLNAYKSIN